MLIKFGVDKDSMYADAYRNILSCPIHYKKCVSMDILLSDVYKIFIPRDQCVSQSACLIDIKEVWEGLYNDLCSPFYVLPVYLDSVYVVSRNEDVNSPQIALRETGKIIEPGKEYYELFEDGIYLFDGSFTKVG